MSWSRSTSRRATSTVPAEEANPKPLPKRSGSMPSSANNDGAGMFGVSCRTASMSNAKTRMPVAGRRLSSGSGSSDTNGEHTSKECGVVDSGGRGNALSRRASSGRRGDGLPPVGGQNSSRRRSMIPQQSQEISHTSDSDATDRLRSLSLGGARSGPGTNKPVMTESKGGGLPDSKPRMARRNSSVGSVTSARRERRNSVGTPSSGDVRGPKVLGEAMKVPHTQGGNIDIIEYAPRTGKPVGIAVVTPGSSGGFGPSIEHQHRGLPLSQQGSLATRGSLYARLGLELSTGMAFDWGNRQVGQGSGGGTVDGSGSFMVVLQMTWRRSENGVKWPAGKLRHLDSLKDSSGDICEVVRWAVKRYGDLPVVLSGFSFGGPSVLAAARDLGSDRIAGVVALSGSARGGSRFVAAKLDTLGAVEELTKQRVPLLFLHGTRDSNVAVEIPIYLTQTATSAVSGHGPVTLGILRGSKHQLDAARDTVYPVFRRFVQECLENHSSGASVPEGNYKVKRLKFVADEDKRRMRKDHILDLAELPQVGVEELQDSSTKGYSE